MKERFDELFGHTWIGQHPTPLKNVCMVLHLDFSVVELGKQLEVIQYSFSRICNGKLAGLLGRYASWI